MATIQGIYLALFGRPADPAGLSYFNGITNNGVNLAGIGNLSGQPEYLARFSGQTNSQIVNSIYQSLFGRDADKAGLDFFVGQLESGRVGINNIAINILDGAVGNDKLVVEAKIAAADLFTSHLDLGNEISAYNGNAAAQIARSYIDSIGTSKAGTGADVDAVILRLLTSAGQGPGGGDGDPGVPVNEAPILTSAIIHGATVENNSQLDVATVTTTDINVGDTFTYALSGANADKFSFDPTTGILKLNAGIDFEALPADDKQLDVTLTVKDQGGLSDAHDFAVNIFDVDDTAPVFTSADGPLSKAEGAAPGTLVYWAQATDSSALTYQLDGADKDFFSVGVADGKVTINASPDYETKSVYNFSVIAKDAWGNHTEKQLVLNIEDVPEGKILDLSPLYGFTIKSAFNVATDKLTIVNDDVDNNWGAGEAPKAVDLTATVQAADSYPDWFNGIVGQATNSNAVVEFNNDFSSAFDDTVSGADLLDALRDDGDYIDADEIHHSTSANGILVDPQGWAGYLVTYADGNAYVFYAASTAIGWSGALSEDEILLVGTLNGVAVGSLTPDNFIAA